MVKLLFDCMNYVSEYKTYMSGLRATIELKIKKLDVNGDLALII